MNYKKTLALTLVAPSFLVFGTNVYASPKQQHNIVSNNTSLAGEYELKQLSQFDNYYIFELNEELQSALNEIHKSNPRIDVFFVDPTTNKSFKANTEITNFSRVYILKDYIKNYARSSGSHDIKLAFFAYSTMEQTNAKHVADIYLTIPENDSNLPLYTPNPKITDIKINEEYSSLGRVFVATALIDSDFMSNQDMELTLDIDEKTKAYNLVDDKFSFRFQTMKDGDIPLSMKMFNKNGELLSELTRSIHIDKSSPEKIIANIKDFRTRFNYNGQNNLGIMIQFNDNTSAEKLTGIYNTSDRGYKNVTLPQEFETPDNQKTFTIPNPRKTKTGNLGIPTDGDMKITIAGQQYSLRFEMSETGLGYKYWLDDKDIKETKRESCRSDKNCTPTY